MRKETQRTDAFRSPGSERRYRNKVRELEKQQRKRPIGRVTWEEIESK